MTFFIELILSGFMNGAIYAVLALGLVVLYKSSSILNFAHGELALLGAFLCYAAINQAGLSIAIALSATLLMSAGIGLFIEVAFLRRLTGQPLISAIMMTLGLAALLRGVVLLMWGPQPRSFELFPSKLLFIGDLVVSLEQIILFILLIGVVLMVGLFFKRTNMGLAMRAASEDHQAARATGVNLKNVFRLALVVACVTATTGGLIISGLYGLDFNISDIGLKAFAVILLGGMDSIAGAIVAGLLVGVLETLAAGYLDPFVGGGVAEIFPYVVLLLLLMIRPYGLFGLIRIERI